MPGRRKRRRPGAAWRWRTLDDFDPGLRAAIKAMGSMTDLAEAIGVAPQAIAQWRIVPVERMEAVEDATGVPRHRLRPDIYKGYRIAN
jgi:DNA-binding transcriptional regulator YdaS (Cro superfamily)